MAEPTKVVIIDDNTDYLFTMETFLSRNGFEVSTAENGKEGLDLILKERPDVVLLDIMMETLFSGFEVCKQLRSDEGLKDMPIIGISGISEEININYEQWPDWEYFSPDAYMSKPVDKDRLLDLIDQVIKKAEERSNRPKWRKDLDEKAKKKWV